MQRKEDNFNVTQDTKGRRVLIVDSTQIPESIEFLKRNGIKHIVVNSACGFHLQQLDFLQNLADFLEGLVVIGKHIDISRINEMLQLRSLGFSDNKKNAIDLSNFPNLEECAVEFSPRLRGLESCKKLLSLTISNYSSSSGDLVGFPRLKNLTKLVMIKSKLKMLDGIGHLNRLRTLRIVRASRLETIAALGELANSIQEVSFEKCEKIRDYESLESLRNIRKLQIFSSGQMQSLKFVKSLEKLDFLSFVGTNVLDGDIHPAIGIEYVGFDDKRHYSHKFSDISGGHE